MNMARGGKGVVTGTSDLDHGEHLTGYDKNTGPGGGVRIVGDIVPERSDAAAVGGSLGENPTVGIIYCPGTEGAVVGNGECERFRSRTVDVAGWGQEIGAIDSGLREGERLAGDGHDAGAGVGVVVWIDGVRDEVIVGRENSDPGIGIGHPPNAARDGQN